MRATTGVSSRRRHKRVLKAAKGYRAVSTRFKTAKQAVMKAGLHAYRGRKEKKRTMRALWILRISNALAPFNVSYSRFMGAATAANVILNRKMISEIAINDPSGFETLLKDLVKGVGSAPQATKKEAPAKAAPVMEEASEETSKETTEATQEAPKTEESAE